EDVLIGTLSFYSEQAEAFEDDHRRVIDAVGAQVAKSLMRALNDARPNHLPLELPPVEQLEHLIDTFTVNERNNHSHTFLVISVKNQLMSGGLSFTEALSYVVKNVRGAIRADDILFRTNDGDLVAFLRLTDIHTADRIASRVRDTLEKSRLRTGTLSS